MTTSDRSSHTRPVTRWRRGADPDVETLRRLYVGERRTEREIAHLLGVKIAHLLGVSRSRVAEAMEQAGIERRLSNRARPTLLCLSSGF